MGKVVKATALGGERGSVGPLTKFRHWTRLVGPNVEGDVLQEDGAVLRAEHHLLVPRVVVAEEDEEAVALDERLRPHEG